MSQTTPFKDIDAPLTGGMFWFAAIVLAAANFFAILDMTIANVSVPSIAGGLAASTSQGTWVITSYAVAEAITVPLTGWLAARFGAVRVFVIAMALFGAFSALCGTSTSLGMLVFARICQGFAGGPLMPLSQTLLLRIFPKEKAAAAGAIETMAYELGAGLGIALFGLILTRSYSSSIVLPGGMDGQVAAQASSSISEAIALAQSLPAVPAHSLIAAAKTAFISAHSIVLATAGVLLLLAAGIWRSLAQAPKMN